MRGSRLNAAVGVCTLRFFMVAESGVTHGTKTAAYRTFEDRHVRRTRSSPPGLEHGEPSSKRSRAASLGAAPAWSSTPISSTTASGSTTPTSAPT
eukprot:5071131-Alexandrium_andersonii.AAC.1